MQILINSKCYSCIFFIIPSLNQYKIKILHYNYKRNSNLVLRPSFIFYLFFIFLFYFVPGIYRVKLFEVFLNEVLTIYRYLYQYMYQVHVFILCVSVFIVLLLLIFVWILLPKLIFFFLITLLNFFWWMNLFHHQTWLCNFQLGTCTCFTD